MRVRSVLVSLVAAALAGGADADERIADIRQGTNMTLALAPDGETLVLSLLGRLWELPTAGGGAIPLTPDGEHARHPRISPDGRRVVYQRHVDGQWELWLLDLEERERRQLTGPPHNDREPDFSADGRAVVFVSDRAGPYSLWRLDLAGDVLTRLTAEAGDASFPAVSERDEVAYVLQRDGQWSLRVLMPRGVSTELVTGPNLLTAPSWRPSGGVIVYNEHHGARSSQANLLLLADEPLQRPLTRGEDVFAGRAAWLSPAEYLYAADGQIWRRGLAQVTRWPVHLFAAVTVQAHSPPLIRTLLDAPGPHAVAGINGRSVSGDGALEVFTALGDLWLRDGSDAPRRLTSSPYVDADPVFTPDGRSVVFASDRDGSMNLWRLDLADERLTQLTDRPGKPYRPAVSPDGTRIAFLETDGLGPWSPGTLAVLRLNAGSGAVQALASDLADVGRPVWDEAGRRIGLTATEPVAAEYVTAWFDADTGRPASAGTPAPQPVFAADMQAGDGQPQSGDTQRSEIDSSGLEWTAHPGAAPYVVQVGRLFDGMRGDYLRHMDIHVEGQRITAIVGRDVRPLPATVIDARDMTVIPGLIDLHAHQSALAGERLGRTWLAYGVTTVREVAADLDAALERGESWASGQRLGPRLIITPAAGRDSAGPAREQPAALVIEGYPGIADGLGHSLIAQSRKLRIQPFPAEPRLLAALERRRDPRGYEPFEVSALSYSYQDVLGTAIVSGTVVTPTLGALGGLGSLGPQWNGRSRDPAYEQLFDATERSDWAFGRGSDGGPLPAALQDTAARIVRGGGRVAAGSDAPAVPYGLGLHAELALLAEAGIPNDQVLRIATAQAALALGLDQQLGTLDQGKLADFVVLSGDPLTRIEDTLSITAIVRGGVWHYRTELLQRP